MQNKDLFYSTGYPNTYTEFFAKWCTSPHEDGNIKRLFVSSLFLLMVVNGNTKIDSK